MVSFLLFCVAMGNGLGHGTLMDEHPTPVHLSSSSQKIQLAVSMFGSVWKGIATFKWPKTKDQTTDRWHATYGFKCCILSHHALPVPYAKNLRVLPWFQLRYSTDSRVSFNFLYQLPCLRWRKASGRGRRHPWDVPTQWQPNQGDSTRSKVSNPIETWGSQRGFPRIVVDVVGAIQHSKVHNFSSSANGLRAKEWWFESLVKQSVVCKP